MTPTVDPLNTDEPDLLDHRKSAQKAFTRHDFATAIRHLERHLQLHPDDLEGELELGLAYLMSGDEERFAAIHSLVEIELAEGPRPSGRLARLWEASRALFAREKTRSP